MTEASHQDYSFLPLSDHVRFDPSPSASNAASSQPVEFRSQFTGCMKLFADSEPVAEYLDVHQGWFCRCAQPMQAEPIGDNGYILTIGHYGSFGFEIEPKIGLRLLPQTQGIYRIETIPLPEEDAQQYQVDFQAELQLVNASTGDADAESSPSPLTHVEWELDLGVAIVFPPFIRRLPQSLIQYTGDQLLKQIVQQVSRRLMAKVQDDFHATLELTPPN